MTEEERAAIDRLVGMGFERNMVIQAYFACDKNEEMTANYLVGGSPRPVPFRGSLADVGEPRQSTGSTTLTTTRCRVDGRTGRRVAMYETLAICRCNLSFVRKSKLRMRRMRCKLTSACLHATTNLDPLGLGMTSETGQLLPRSFVHAQKDGPAESDPDGPRDDAFPDGAETFFFDEQGERLCHASRCTSPCPDSASRCGSSRYL